MEFHMRVGIIYTQYIAHSLGWFPAYSKKVPVRYMNIHDICNKYIHGSSSIVRSYGQCKIYK